MLIKKICFFFSVKKKLQKQLILNYLWLQVFYARGCYSTILLQFTFTSISILILRLIHTTLSLLHLTSFSHHSYCTSLYFHITLTLLQVTSFFTYTHYNFTSLSRHYYFPFTFTPKLHHFHDIFILLSFSFHYTFT